ncbi:hypothetical protein ABW19_dt0207400 [Dactylella cylindrospora]|nr:hypothetical protein ABW19_dt0207400 [Dactylella cylindrospora]
MLFMDFTTLFNCFRFVPLIQEIWKAYPPHKQKKRLSIARIIEDKPLYDALSMVDQDLVDRLVKAGLKGLVPSEVDNIQYMDLSPVAIHAVILARIYKQQTRLGGDCKEDGVLIWEHAQLLVHWNKLSTIRLFDVFDQLDLFDKCIGKMGHIPGCTCAPSHLGFMDPRRALYTDWSRDCRPDYEYLKLAAGIASNLDVWIETFDSGRMPGTDQYDSIFLAATDYLESKSIPMIGLTEDSTGKIFLGEVIRNRVLFPYRYDSRLELHDFEGLKGYEPFTVDIRTLMALYSGFVNSGESEWDIVACYD